MEQMELNVNLGSRAYPIHFGRGLLEHLADYVNLDRKVLVLTDDGVPKSIWIQCLPSAPTAVRKSCRWAKALNLSLCLNAFARGCWN